MSGTNIFASRSNGNAIINNQAYVNVRGHIATNRIIRNNLNNIDMGSYIESFNKSFNRNKTGNADKITKFIEIVFNVHRYIKTRAAGANNNNKRKAILEKLSIAILELVVYLVRRKNDNTLDATLKGIFGKKTNGEVTGIKETTFKRALNIIGASNRTSNLLSTNGLMMSLRKESANKETNNKEPKLSRYNVILAILGKIVVLAKGPARTPIGEVSTNAGTQTEIPKSVNASVETGTGINEIGPMITETNNVNGINKSLEKIINSHRELSNASNNNNNGNNGSNENTGNVPENLNNFIKNLSKQQSNNQIKLAKTTINKIIGILEKNKTSKTNRKYNLNNQEINKYITRLTIAKKAMKEKQN